jgi:GDP-L-fucose synthase
MTIDLEPSVFVAGHRGLVGSAICRRLAKAGVQNVLTVPREELDLRDQNAVNQWFEQNRPDQVYLVAGTVGGIMANSTRQAEFLYDNLMIHATVVEAARRTEVSKLLYLGSACVYPRLSPQPIPESALLTGPLEPTNEGYSLAKIAGMRLCEFYREQYGCNFITAMPTNLYGPGDNFDLRSSHVLPALMRKFHEAKVRGVGGVEIWGTGSARREFLHVDDLADACLFLMDRYEGKGHINIGTGIDLSIGDLATMIRDIVYPGADMFFDPTKPDGMPRRVLDVTALTDLGWRAGIELQDGLASTYEWFLSAMEDPERAAITGRSLHEQPMLGEAGAETV